MVAESRTFEGVSVATWERMRAGGRDNHGTVFEEASDSRGTATTSTPVGTIVLEYAFDPIAEQITYTIVRKPMLAASSLIWGGIAATLERCRQSSNGSAIVLTVRPRRQPPGSRRAWRASPLSPARACDGRSARCPAGGRSQRR